MPLPITLASECLRLKPYVLGGEGLKGRHYLVSILDTVIPRHTEDAWKVVVDVEFKGWWLGCLQNMGKNRY